MVGTTLVGKGLAGGSPEHLEGETILGEVREVAEEGRSVPNHLSKVIPHSGPGGATLWFVNLGSDGRDAAKPCGGTCEFHPAGDRD